MSHCPHIAEFKNAVGAKSGKMNAKILNAVDLLFSSTIFII